MNFLYVYDGSHSACGSIPRESWDKNFKISQNYLGYYFSKLNTKLNFLLVYDGSHSACGSIPRESWDKILKKYLGSILDIIFSKYRILSTKIYRRWILAFAVASHKNLEVHIFENFRSNSTINQLIWSH